MSPLLLAVDVGTLSARAGLFDDTGELLAATSCGFDLMRPEEHHAVYRMDEIWAAVGGAARDCLAEVRGAAERVAGLAFDATSSVVLSGPGPRPLSGDADVFCWMDHRGEAEAAEIGASGDLVLDYVGGSMSPEMHLPKLLWLKRRDPAAWARITAVRDLCDELAFRATGADVHSACGLACKWGYLPNAGGWRPAFLAALGMADLTAKGALRHPPRPVAAVHGRVTASAAVHLGLPAGIPVAVGLIDAEAGTLGVLGRSFGARMNETAALIGGTSTCIMAFARDERRIPAVWGPFKDAVFSGLWLHEAGQSLTGAALDAVLAHHPGGPGLASPEGHAAATRAILDLLDREGPAFAAQRHIVPDWLGNRSPLGDGTVRALATGLGEDTTERAFLETYYATARALVLQARQILEHLDRHGYAIRRVALSGGHAKNPLLLRLYQDALGAADLVLSNCPEPVLLGTAMTAAVAAGLHPDLFDAVEALAPVQHAVPADQGWRKAHDIAYEMYLKLFETRNEVESGACRLRAAWSE